MGKGFVGQIKKKKITSKNWIFFLLIDILEMLQNGVLKQAHRWFNQYVNSSYYYLYSSSRLTKN